MKIWKEMMNYPEQPTRPLKRLPMAHIVTVTGKLSVKGGYFSFFQNLGPPGIVIATMYCLFSCPQIREVILNCLLLFVPCGRPGKTNFGTNLSFAAKFPVEQSEPATSGI